MKIAWNTYGSLIASRVIARFILDIDCDQSNAVPSTKSNASKPTQKTDEIYVPVTFGYVNTGGEHKS